MRYAGLRIREKGPTSRWMYSDILRRSKAKVSEDDVHEDEIFGRRLVLIFPKSDAENAEAMTTGQK